MAETPTRVNQIARSWQFQLCTWAGPVVAWYRLSGISSEAQHFRYASSTCMLLPPPYRSVSRQFCLLASAREAVACCWLRYISRGPSLWPSLVVEWVFARREWDPSLWPTLVIEWVFVRRERRLRLFWAFGRLSYIFRGPSLSRAPLGYFYNAPHWGGLFRAPL